MEDLWVNLGLVVGRVCGVVASQTGLVVEMGLRSKSGQRKCPDE